jgi:hypothetical protein
MSEEFAQYSPQHVEFLERFCGEHCVARNNWHCVTCHRNAELRMAVETHDWLKRLIDFLDMVAQSPMAQAMGGGMAQGGTIVGFGKRT